MNEKQDLEISSESDLFPTLIQVREKLGNTPSIWWRGHARIPEWKLRPRVYRDPDEHGHNYEQNVTANFIRQAPVRYQNFPTPNLDRLFLMQHYGAPTRLLDWTHSPLVALSFAVSYEYEKYKSEPGRLWAMNPYSLNKSMGYKAVVPAASAEEMEAIKNMVRAAFGEKLESPNKVLALHPVYRDLRMLVQQSSFTIHGIATPLEDVEGSKKCRIPITVTPDGKREIKEMLSAYKISSSTLFPDLEHLAIEVASPVYQ